MLLGVGQLLLDYSPPQLSTFRVLSSAMQRGVTLLSSKHALSLRGFRSIIRIPLKLSSRFHPSCRKYSRSR